MVSIWGWGSRGTGRATGLGCCAQSRPGPCESSRGLVLGEARDAPLPGLVGMGSLVLQGVPHIGTYHPVQRGPSLRPCSLTVRSWAMIRVWGGGRGEILLLP